MKYLPLRGFETVTTALNFSTQDCHVIGSCDVYTTKAAGGDKKLYKTIENSLESQYESLVRLSASLSPPCRSAASDDGKAHSDKPRRSGSGSSAGKDNDPRKRRHRTVEPPEIDLSRASPFGPLSQITARRTFAYLIATLNASHPDYDFSYLLRPTDFRKERSLRNIMATVDSTLQNLRPKSIPSSAYLSPPSLSASAPPVTSYGNDVWSPRMWSLIDKEMGLRNCEKYSYAPDDDPFDGEEGPAIWSLHYFFFSKERKRVCYLYLRGLSVISHSPVNAPVYHIRQPQPAARKASSYSTVGEGAGKRASYWLGSRFLDREIDMNSYGDDDDDEMVIDEPGDDEVDIVPQMDLDDIRAGLEDGYYNHGDYEDEGIDVYHESWLPRHVRGVSEEVGELVEV